MKKLFAQIMKFGVVGFLCFFIDYGVLYGLTEWAGMNYLLSSICSFSISVIINYILSVMIVFDVKEGANKAGQFAAFVVLSLIGLGLNTIIMKVGVETFGIYYMLTKIIATAIVMVYNFISRKLFLEDRKTSSNQEDAG